MNERNGRYPIRPPPPTTVRYYVIKNLLNQMRWRNRHSRDHNGTTSTSNLVAACHNGTTTSNLVAACHLLPGPGDLSLRVTKACPTATRPMKMRSRLLELAMMPPLPHLLLPHHRLLMRRP